MGNRVSNSPDRGSPGEKRHPAPRVILRAARPPHSPRADRGRIRSRPPGRTRPFPTRRDAQIAPSSRPCPGFLDARASASSCRLPWMMRTCGNAPRRRLPPLAFPSELDPLSSSRWVVGTGKLQKRSQEYQEQPDPFAGGESAAGADSLPQRFPGWPPQAAVVIQAGDGCEPCAWRAVGVWGDFTACRSGTHASVAVSLPGDPPVPGAWRPGVRPVRGPKRPEDGHLTLQPHPRSTSARRAAPARPRQPPPALEP